MSRILIEECPYLAISAIKQDLKRHKRKDDNVIGIFNIGYGNKKKACDYWFEDVADSTFLVISITGNIPQHILIAEQELQFGARSYFVCSCDKQASKLYLPPGEAELRCRSCYGLRYELSTINRSSSQGRLMYMTNRTIKLSNQRVEMNRIFYKNKYTKRYERYLKLCGKAGFNNIVQDARELMAAIKNQ